MMDTTPEYIKMCEKAIEVQEQWDLEDDTNYIGQIIDDYAMTEVYMGHFINSSIQVLKANNQGQQYVWLPRQDQLQEMFSNKVNILFHKFNDWINHRETVTDIPLNNPFITMEQLWLAFVMKEKFNKVWNGEDWVKA